MNPESRQEPESTGAAVPNASADSTATEADLIFLLGADGAVERVDEVRGSGVGASELVSTSFFRHIHQTDLMRVFQGVEELVSGREEEVAVGFHLRTTAGLWRFVRGTMKRWGDGPTTAGIMLTLQLLTSVS